MLIKIYKKVLQSGKLTLIAASAALVGGLTSAVVLAAIPDSNGIIHSCRDNIIGTIRVIDDSNQSCTASETSLNWSNTQTTVNAIDTDYTLADSDNYVVGDASAGDIVVTLPTAVGKSGRTYTIKDSVGSAGHYIVLMPATGEILDGSTDGALIGSGGAKTIVSDGSGWQIVNDFSY